MHIGRVYTIAPSLIKKKLNFTEKGSLFFLKFYISILFLQVVKQFFTMLKTEK